MKINNFREYPKEYEDVFSNERFSRFSFNINLVSTDIELNSSEYSKKIRELMLEYQKNAFDFIVKFSWLIRRFCYEGKNRAKNGLNGSYLDSAFSIFFLKYVGLSYKMINSNSSYSKIIGYLDDFFPDLDARNPFKEKLEYPYKNVSFEYLFFVYQMDERIELLKIAEERNMSYAVFMDYVTNYVGCLNEEKGEKYWIRKPIFVPPYVKKINIKKRKNKL